jgi:hypothetical protein
MGMVRIAASKGNMTAVFTVSIKRMAYFFQDRDVVINERGHSKPVFHIVRAHVRKDGSTVPFHFRGLREFEWAGYKIKITVPFRDHQSLATWDKGCVDELLWNPNEPMIRMKEFGALLAKAMDWRHRHGKRMH